MKKIFFILLILIMVVSNLFLIGQNNELTRENRRLKLFRPQEQVVPNQELEISGAEVISTVLSDRNQREEVALRALFLRANQLEIQLAVTDLNVLEDMERQLTDTLNIGKPQVEIQETEGVVSATIRYNDPRRGNQP